jgi:hypothetical protein
MATDPIADLKAEAVALKAKFAALPPDVLRGALTSLVTGSQLNEIIDDVQMLFDALPAGDPLKPHISAWLQVSKNLPMLVKSVAG